MTKLTPEQVEKLEDDARTGEHLDPDTILTLCREWREMLAVIDALHNGADHKEYKGVHEDEWSDRASRICQRSRP